MEKIKKIMESDLIEIKDGNLKIKGYFQQKDGGKYDYTQTSCDEKPIKEALERIRKEGVRDYLNQEEQEGRQWEEDEQMNEEEILERIEGMKKKGMRVIEPEELIDTLPDGEYLIKNREKQK